MALPSDNSRLDVARRSYSSASLNSFASSSNRARSSVPNPSRFHQSADFSARNGSPRTLNSARPNATPGGRFKAPLADGNQTDNDLRRSLGVKRKTALSSVEGRRGVMGNEGRRGGALTKNCGSLTTDLLSYFEQQSSNDVQVVCQDNIFHSNRILLSARSSVFSCMLGQTNSFLESQMNRVEINDAQPHIVESFLEAVHTDRYVAYRHDEKIVILRLIMKILIYLWFIHNLFYSSFHHGWMNFYPLGSSINLYSHPLSFSSIFIFICILILLFLIQISTSSLS